MSQFAAARWSTELNSPDLLIPTEMFVVAVAGEADEDCAGAAGISTVTTGGMSISPYQELSIPCSRPTSGIAGRSNPGSAAMFVVGSKLGVEKRMAHLRRPGHWS